MHWIDDLVFGQLRDEGQYQFPHVWLFFDHDFEQVRDGRLGHFRRNSLIFPLLYGLVGGLLGQQVGHHGVDFGKYLLSRGSFFAILQILRALTVGLLMSFIFAMFLVRFCKVYMEKRRILISRKEGIFIFRMKFSLTQSLFLIKTRENQFHEILLFLTYQQ